MLTEDQILLRDTAQAYALEQLAPHAEAWEKAKDYPPDLLNHLGEMGFMGMMIPEAYGGLGSDYVSYALALEAIGSGDGGVGTLVSVHNSPTASCVTRFGSEAQKQRFLPAMASGTLYGSFALTEPGAGSDAAALKTRAVRQGDAYVLNGAKQFITGGGLPGICIVFAVTDPTAGKRGISAFIVPKQTPGYQVLRVEDKMGQRACNTAALAFNDMEISQDLLLGAEGDGYKIALSTLESGRIGIGAISVGMAQAALDHAVAYAKDRRAFDQPIFDFQAVGFRLADMATKLEASRQLVLNAARMKDAGEPCLKQAAMAKLFASEAAEDICSAAIQTLGGYGYLSDYPVERIYRDVRLCTIYEGTSDIQKLLIARQLG